MAPRYEVVKEKDIWVLRLVKANGKVQLYRCATERQAHTLAVLLSLQDPLEGTSHSA